MTKRSISLFCIFIALAGTSIHAADIGDGFSGLKWGINKSMVDNLVKLSSKENVDYYVKPNEVYIINNTRVAQVCY